MQFTVRVHIDVAERAPRRPAILVLSGDQEWRSVVERVLEREGYDVLPARHAGQALVTWMRHEGRIDLLLSEGADGHQLSELSPRMARNLGGVRWLHLDTRPSCGEQLIAAVTCALSSPATSSDQTPHA